jgi:hypothetical protein
MDYARMILKNTGFPELIAEDQTVYVELAVGLVPDPMDSPGGLNWRFSRAEAGAINPSDARRLRGRSETDAAFAEYTRSRK